MPSTYKPASTADRNSVVSLSYHHKARLLANTKLSYVPKRMGFRSSENAIESAWRRLIAMGDSRDEFTQFGLGERLSVSENLAGYMRRAINSGFVDLTAKTVEPWSVVWKRHRHQLIDGARYSDDEARESAWAEVLQQLSDGSQIAYKNLAHEYGVSAGTIQGMVDLATTHLTGVSPENAPSWHEAKLQFSSHRNAITQAREDRYEALWKAVCSGRFPPQECFGETLAKEFDVSVTTVSRMRKLHRTVFLGTPAEKIPTWAEARRRYRHILHPSLYAAPKTKAVEDVNRRTERPFGAERVREWAQRVAYLQSRCEATIFDVAGDDLAGTMDALEVIQAKLKVLAGREVGHG